MFRISFSIILSIVALCHGLALDKKLTCDYPWIQIESNSTKCYLQSRTTMSWFKGDLFCKQNGGMLAEPRTAEETDLIDKFCLADVDYWIGLTDLAIENNWIWDSDYSQPDYTNWYSSPSSSGSDCAYKYGNHKLKWDDYSCDSYKHALCQKEL